MICGSHPQGPGISGSFDAGLQILYVRNLRDRREARKLQFSGPHRSLPALVVRPKTFNIFHVKGHLRVRMLVAWWILFDRALLICILSERITIGSKSIDGFQSFTIVEGEPRSVFLALNAFPIIEHKMTSNDIVSIVKETSSSTINTPYIPHSHNSSAFSTIPFTRYAKKDEVYIPLNDEMMRLPEVIERVSFWIKRLPVCKVVRNENAEREIEELRVGGTAKLNSP
uniref:Uncharacterized protein n=1 Tax=Parascaris equorum TaxID=6256 RepID=A0A914RN17_PAREQ